MANTKSFTDEEELALYNSMKELPDFRSFPIPVSWFKKFNIAPLETIAPKQFIDSQYTIKCALGNKDLPPLIINKPQTDKDGNIILAELRPPEDIKVEVITRPFELKEGEEFPTILPMLSELPIPEEDLKAMEERRVARWEKHLASLTDEERERTIKLEQQIFHNLNDPDYVAPESEED